MATGPEMLISTLVKLFKLEPEVEKIRSMIKQVASDDLIGQIKQGLEKVESFDRRLARIEQKLGIEPGPGASDVECEPRLNRHDPPQLANGADSGRPGYPRLSSGTDN